MYTVFPVGLLSPLSAHTHMPSSFIPPGFSSHTLSLEGLLFEASALPHLINQLVFPRSLYHLELLSVLSTPPQTPFI